MFAIVFYTSSFVTRFQGFFFFLFLSWPNRTIGAENWEFSQENHFMLYLLATEATLTGRLMSSLDWEVQMHFGEFFGGTFEVSVKILVHCRKSVHGKQQHTEPFAPQSLLCSLSLHSQGHILIFPTAQTVCGVRLHMQLGKSNTCWFTQNSEKKSWSESHAPPRTA